MGKLLHSLSGLMKMAKNPISSLVYFNKFHGKIYDISFHVNIACWTTSRLSFLSKLTLDRIRVNVLICSAFLPIQSTKTTNNRLLNEKSNKKTTTKLEEITGFWKHKIVNHQNHSMNSMLNEIRILQIIQIKIRVKILDE